MPQLDADWNEASNHALVGVHKLIPSQVIPRGIAVRTCRTTKQLRVAFLNNLSSLTIVCLRSCGSPSCTKQRNARVFASVVTRYCCEATRCKRRSGVHQTEQRGRRQHDFVSAAARGSLGRCWKKHGTRRELILFPAPIVHYHRTQIPLCLTRGGTRRHSRATRAIQSEQTVPETIRQSVA